jgi:CubicO group peptidase (beta-lactamase class C family)
MRTISALILLLTLNNLYAQLQPALKSRLDSFFRKQPADKPGFVLSIEKHGGILYRNAVGLASLDTKQPLDPTTNFRMASVTKQFTAMGILLLEKQGRLSVDDPIGRWLPELPARIGKTILIRHLLTHTSGILDYESLIPETQTRQVFDAEVGSLLSKQDSTLFTPGSRFRYSNSGYCLLALIIEKANSSYANFIQSYIFNPLHMDSSTVYIPGGHIPRRAMGYARDTAGRIIPSDQSVTSATKGDGGVYTSLSDYAKWTRALQQNKLINLPATLKRLRLPIDGNPSTPERPEAVRPKEPSLTYYAAGWFIRTTDPLLLFHSGSTCGFNNYVVQIPADETTIVCFSNYADNRQTFEKISDILKSANFIDLSPVFQLHDLTR